MSGRAGRRGLDDRGNIIFHNVKNYLELMKGSLPKLELIEGGVYDTYNIVNLYFNNLRDFNKVIWSFWSTSLPTEIIFKEFLLK